MVKSIVAVVVAAVALCGCQLGGTGPRQEIGALTGAVGGAFLGNEVGKGKGRILATAAGTLAGMAIGADIGRSLDRANAAYTARTEPVAHSQQTPVPGFASQRADGTRYYSAGSHRGVSSRSLEIRDAQGMP